jgi:peptide/nickel transport system substrate-binding protein
MLRSKKLTRRGFLRMSAATAAVTTLAACGGGAAPTGPSAPTAAPAGEPTAAPAGAATAVPAAPTSPPAATAVPSVATKFQQAPSLDAMADLPPVDERLPANPYTPPHSWVGVGKYGGVLNKTYKTDAWGTTGLIHEMQYGNSPLRWLKDGLAIGPGLVESW